MLKFPLKTYEKFAMLSYYMTKLFLLLLTISVMLSCENKTEPPLIQEVTPLQKNVYSIKYGEVKRGEGLYQALKNVSIDNVLALQLINNLRDEVEFSKLKVGDSLEATFDQNEELVEFSFSQNPAEKHVVKLNRKTGQWDYSFKEEKTFWHSRVLEGQLKDGSTLLEDLLAQGLKPSVVNEIVNVLLLKVNFRINARIGDRFKVLLNERWHEDSIIQTKLLYTSYHGLRAGFHEAFLYEDEEKSSTYTAHYTEDGEALVSSGLRYPLTRLHVRSGYGWRRHPVTGKRAMHSGVDLRGRLGSPVHAVAEGRVIESSYNEYAGNKVGIRHLDGSKSYYLHLAKRSVNAGAWVNSHQIIGTVGATGRVTGPHLHFGFKTPTGSWMNPLNKRMIATPKLSGRHLNKLKDQIAITRGLMIDLELIQDAKYLLANIPNKKEEFSINFLNQII
jgi:murein DD-endopeptidase MepM/ murein hydrolase activator NlpD